MSAFLTALDAMKANGGDEYGERDNYYLGDACYVSVFLKGVGLFAGFLYTKEKGLAPVEYRMQIFFKHRTKLIADLISIHIEPQEHLPNSRYYIQTRKEGYVVSGLLSQIPKSLEFPVLLTQAVRPDIYQHTSELKYFEGTCPLWTEEIYFHQRVNQYLHRHAASGSGQSSVPQDNKNKSKKV